MDSKRSLNPTKDNNSISFAKLLKGVEKSYEKGKCLYKRLDKEIYKLIGFSENTNGEFGIVLQQPFVQDAKLATPEQWDTHLTSRQFKKAKLTSLQGVEGYLDGEYELSDFKPENVLVDKNGDLRYIDLDISMVIVEDADLRLKNDRYRYN